MTPTPAGARPVPMTRTCPLRPPEELDGLRASAPVERVSFPNGAEGWLVTGYENARTVLNDPAFSVRSPEYAYFARSGGTAVPPVPKGMFLSLDPPEHTSYRKLLDREFSARRMNQLRPRIQQVIDQCLDGLEASGPPADLMAGLAYPVPLRVISDLLGVPAADRAEFKRVAEGAMRLDVTPEGQIAANQRLDEYLGAVIRRKRARPSDDLLSGLIARSGEDDLLDDGALVNIGKLLFIAGYETTANAIGLGVAVLAEHPGQHALLRDDPGLVDRAVEEILRHQTLAHLGIQRVAVRDVELGGVTIAAGDIVMAHTAAANLDEALTPDAADLRVDRRPTAHLTFGFGPHQCLGRQLARIELQMVFTSLLARFPGMRLAAGLDEVPFRSGMVIYGMHRLPVTW
ncbi:cytochrome P450 [Actinomadura madurae]|uniref:cytochrome P450 n=1 Tax=Actinomadura madurae TaxID=1993 RepID=UPI0020265725|nr:cytochrome P450 [Actinomadura madurae]MCP9955770.1 cytochrome P450 [Actinomadura madurae]MCP9972509.1 cytochrome P450 [Actinomadura madurae]MCP9985003.1 cytochrome P450 [Actinomadura madurae]MCQ0003426.1 cytochrome P450 [Actinomadura madurae]URN03338.1 cytochrome P450 [Actinomadura madurae]